MDKSTLKRLNALKKKLKEWEKQGYDVSSLKEDIEAFERQERKKKARKVVLITLLVLAIIGGGLTAVGKKASRGLVYIGTNSKGYKEYKNIKDGSILIYIPAGEFTMGSPSGEGYDNEHPQHKVYLSGYYIGKYEVTNRQYKKFCDATGHPYPPDLGFSGMDNYFENYPDYPVVGVSWNDAVAYCKWAGLRLPTEAEWEKAARGGEDYKYAGSNNPNEVGWYYGNSGSHTHPVGQKRPNGYGIYDISGNVWEWCSDWYDSGYYSNSPYRNPKGPASGSFRVGRGGSWSDFAGDFRCANRDRSPPDNRYYGLGFRVARSP